MATMENVATGGKDCGTAVVLATSSKDTASKSRFIFLLIWSVHKTDVHDDGERHSSSPSRIAYRKESRHWPRTSLSWRSQPSWTIPTFSNTRQEAMFSTSVVAHMRCMPKSPKPKFKTACTASVM